MVKIFIKFCVLVLLFGIFQPPIALARNNDAQAVIFMYHRFGEPRYPSTNVTIEQFESQLDFFENNNFSILPVSEIIEALQQNKPLPEKTVAITIDDAYLSVYENAYPRLKAKGYAFTVFIATDGIDQGNPAYMTWSQIQKMQKSGVQFANHSTRHDYLTRRVQGESMDQWKDRIKKDISTAEKRIEEKLGQVSALFAYPYGEYNLELMQIIADLGYTAFGQHSGGVNALSDRRALPRFPVAEAYADMKSFRTKALSVALPVVQKQPVEPVTSKKRPQLTISLAPSSANLAQLTCYLGDKRMIIHWQEPKQRFTIQAEDDLPAGRSRYNCTAPDSDRDRYFWFSHQWLRL